MIKVTVGFLAGIFAVSISIAVPALANEVRVDWLSTDCPNAPPPVAPPSADKVAPVIAGLISAIAPKFVSGGVDLVAKSLQAAGTDRADVLTGRSDANFYQYLVKRQNTILARCIVIVEAESFDAEIPEDEAWRLGASNVGRYRNPRYILEARLQKAAEGKLFRLQPVYMKVGSWRKWSFVHGEDRNYTVALTMSMPGAEKKFASAEFSFKAVSSNTTYTAGHALLSSAVSSFMPLPEQSAEGTQYIASIETAWASKDRAASLLNTDAKLKDAGAKDAIMAGGPAGPEPSLTASSSSTYTLALSAYCDLVEAGNKRLPAAARTIPADCNWKSRDALKKVEAAKTSAERSADFLAWAAKTCWPDMTVRAEMLSKPFDKGGVVCAPPENDPKDPNPHTLFETTVALAEIIPGSKLAKFLGDALAEAKADVSKVITERLPAITDQAKDAEDAADRSARQAVVLADLAVELAQNELDEQIAAQASMSKITDKRVKLQKAWYDANEAYRKVGRLPVYPEAS